MKKDAANPDWSSVEKRPTWGTVTSMELAQILGVSLQAIHNDRIRTKALPLPMPRQRGQGNKNRYKISAIRSWLEQRPENEIHWEWIERFMGEGFHSIEQAVWNAQRHWQIFDVEKPVP